MNHFFNQSNGIRSSLTQLVGDRAQTEDSASVETFEPRNLPSQSSKQGNRFLKTVLIPVLKRLLRVYGNPPIKLTLPDGTLLLPSHDKRGNKKEAIGIIHFRDYRVLFGLLIDPLFQFGEAYSNKKIELEGDLSECLATIYRCMSSRSSPSVLQRMLYWWRRPGTNSLRGSRLNIHHHYDLGNDFYRLWLDEKMLYTCAYFARKEFSLEQAQVAKMDHICRKLRLQPGMEVVEAGCGWGALTLHMAKHYGARVKAFNISVEQIAYASREAERLRIQDQVEFILDDWRNINGQFDAFVSVGMLEHVGVKNYRQLGETVVGCLKPEGLGLIHTIGQNKSLPLNSWIERRIFPGAYVPSLKEMMEIFEGSDFQVLDVENLRLHYAQTLRHWLDRFESSSEFVQQLFDERFVRMWRLYLAGSVAAFESGWLQLFQVVFANGASNSVPRTREHLYRTEPDLRRV